MDDSNTRRSLPQWTLLDEDELVSEVDETLYGESNTGIETEDELEDSGDPGTQEKPRLAQKVYDLIANTYRQCWQQFYGYEQSKSLQDLRGLANTSDNFFANDPSQYVWIDEFIREDFMDVEDTTSFVSFTVEDERSSTKSIIMMSKQEQAIMPGPRYFSCTPTSCYIRGNEPSFTTLQYIRYGGVRDSSFDEREYMRSFHSVAWQNPLQDPDFFLIVFEAIMRLSTLTNDEIQMSSGTRIFLDDIAEAGIFTGGVDHNAATDHLRDIVHRIKQRDQWPWPDCRFPVDAEIAQTYKPARRMEEDNLLDCLDKISSSFCPYLECVKAACEAHPYSTGWKMQDAVIPRKSNKALEQCGKSPCNNQCYLTSAIRLAYETIQTKVNTSKIKLEEQLALESILAIEPDTLPCIVARLLKDVTCVQVFAYRSEKVPEDALQLPIREGKKPPQWNDLPNDGAVDKFVSVSPCHCSGPCTAVLSQCECHRKGYHCQRTCRCARTCALRYKGCHYQKKGRKHCAYIASVELNNPLSRKRVCRCRSHGWECDPERCHVDAKSLKNDKPCQNMDLLLQRYPQVEVKRSDHGFGTFTNEFIRAHTFLGDYVADLTMNNRLNAAREMISKAAGLNYSFTLTPEEVLDAFNSGNETRFVNDPMDETLINVEAVPKYVHGNHHIAYYTVKDIRKGQELLLSYGKDFWKDLKETTPR